MADADIAWVAGIPETKLDPALHARLPTSAPAAPWECRCDMLLWTTRAGRAATAAVPERLRGRAKALTVVAGFVSYHDTPVGAYDEVFAAIGFRHGAGLAAHVGFMAVDSRASLVGGRLNWGMPKTLAEFTGDFRSRFAARNVAGAGWRVGATSVKHVLFPRVPLRAGFTVHQLDAKDDPRAAELWLRGRMRPVPVWVDTEGPFGLAELIRPGVYMGVRVSDATLRLSAPETKGDR